MSEDSPAQSRSSAFYIAIILFTTVFAFRDAFVAEFTLLDDAGNIWQNPRLNPPTLQSIGHYWRNSEFGLYVPLTYTVWGALAKIVYVEQADAMGVYLDAWIFHGTNVVLHVASALIVFFLLKRLVLAPAAAVGAMFFAVHPVQVEPVAWAAGLKDVLAGMLTLAALWQYLVFAQNPKKTVSFILATAAFVLGMLAKPSALVAPLLAGAIDLWIVRRPVKSIVRSLAPWMVLSVACAVIARLVQPAADVASAPFWARPFIAGDTIAFYLYKIFWPIRLAFDYGHKPDYVMEQWWFWVAWLIPVVVLAIAWRTRRRWPHLWVGTVILIAAIGPVLGFVTFLFQRYSTTADHYLYIAMLGPAIILAYTIQRAAHSGVAIAICLAVGLLAVKTIQQTRTWSRDATIYANTLSVNPRSVLALKNMGYLHLSVRQFDDAEWYYTEALRFAPDDPDELDNLALAQELQNRFSDAIPNRRRAFELRMGRQPEQRGDVVGSLDALSRDLIEIGELDEARKSLLRAQEIDPANKQTRQMLESVKEKLTTRPTSNAA